MVGFFKEEKGLLYSNPFSILLKADRNMFQKQVT
jgi:hypothetical protein